MEVNNDIIFMGDIGKPSKDSEYKNEELFTGVSFYNGLMDDDDITSLISEDYIHSLINEITIEIDKDEKLNQKVSRKKKNKIRPEKKQKIEKIYVEKGNIHFVYPKMPYVKKIEIIEYHSDYLFPSEYQQELVNLLYEEKLFSEVQNMDDTLIFCLVTMLGYTGEDINDITIQINENHSTKKYNPITLGKYYKQGEYLKIIGQDFHNVIEHFDNVKNFCNGILSNENSYIIDITNPISTIIENIEKLYLDQLEFAPEKYKHFVYFWEMKKKTSCYLCFLMVLIQCNSSIIEEVTLELTQDFFSQEKDAAKEHCNFLEKCDCKKSLHELILNLGKKISPLYNDKRPKVCEMCRKLDYLLRVEFPLSIEIVKEHIESLGLLNLNK